MTRPIQPENGNGITPANEPMLAPDVNSETDYTRYLHGEGVVPGSEAERHILAGRQLHMDAKAREQEFKTGSNVAVADAPVDIPAEEESLLGNSGDRTEAGRIRSARKDELAALPEEKLFIKPAEARDLGSRAVQRAKEAPAGSEITVRKVDKDSSVLDSNPIF